MLVRCVMWVSLASIAGTAWAGDKPVYAPAPDWVKPAPAPAIAALRDDTPVLVTLDSQQRVQDGQSWAYTETTTRAASSEVLNSIGTVTLPWLPDKGDLIIHRAQIIRGTEHIDLLAGGQKFEVLHREEQLEQRMLTGLLTATLQVEGLRVGDVLNLAFSITQKDSALKGNVQLLDPLLTDKTRVGFARLRVLWPERETLTWKTFGQGAQPQVTTVNGYHELAFPLPLAKQPEMPSDAPLRFRRPPLFMATSFKDWSAVSGVMAPLYATDGLIAPGSPLAAEVARIAGAEHDPMKRANLALQLVQDQVRYLYKGMDAGNYVPQSPAQSWASRYGDCKAKTLLLLALLHGLGVEAEPVLASIGGGDLIPDGLPLPGAFNHILVRATIGGDVLWLDGTGSGAELADIHDVPPFRYVLPVRAGGAALMTLPLRAGARPMIAFDIDLDESAGLNLPAPFKIAVTVRGGLAAQLRATLPQLGKEDLRKLAMKLTTDHLDDPVIVAQSVSFDQPAGTATVTASGLSYPTWPKEDQRLRTSLDKTIAAININPDRNRVAWKDIPVATDVPVYLLLKRTVHLPDQGKGFTLDGNRTLADTIFGTKVDRRADIADGTATIEDHALTTGAEIPVADLPGERTKLARAKSHPLKIVAPADYPPFWQEVAAAKRNHRLDRIAAVLDQAVADQPDKADPLVDRAFFYERTFDWRKAIDDLGRAIALDPGAGTYLARARVHATIGETAQALADNAAARKADPSSIAAITQYAVLSIETGKIDDALALLDERIAAGGTDKPDLIVAKTEMLARTGKRDEAIEETSAAIAASPGNPTLLNARCWLEGTTDTALDGALKDCTKAMQLSDSQAHLLDSRAMVYFRMNKLDEALADLNAALDLVPDLAESLYMRGIIRKKTGAEKEAAVDLAGARTMEPMIDRDYSRFGIKP